MKAVVKDGKLIDPRTGNRLFAAYGSAVTGINFDKLSDAPDGTEYNIMNIWDSWEIFDPDDNHYHTILKSKYMQVEKIYEPPTEQTFINKVGDDNGDSGNCDNDNTSGISDSSDNSIVAEQPNVSNEVSGDNTAEHTDSRTAETDSGSTATVN